MVQSEPGKNNQPLETRDEGLSRFWPRRPELVEMLQHAGIILVIVFSVSSLYALACMPAVEVDNESIRQPVDIIAPPLPDPQQATSSVSDFPPTLPGIARPPRSNRPAPTRQVLQGIETRVKHLAEILPERYPVQRR